LNGVVIPQEAVFSFWKQVGRSAKRKGYVTGRMLQQGCLIPSIGGGLCQLSNALYDVCLRAGCDVIERHGHSKIVPGSAAVYGRDATVAWNYVDFRFSATEPTQIESFLTQDQLVVRLRGVRAGVRQTAPTLQIMRGADLHVCSTCGEDKCFRHTKSQSTVHKEPEPRVNL
jgi:vancomycin resistance protein VanW